jgi:hypothetical protein
MVKRIGALFAAFAIVLSGCSMNGIRTRVTQMPNNTVRVELFYDGETPDPSRPPVCCVDIDLLNPDDVQSCLAGE